MPRIDDMDEFALPGSPYGYSATPIEQLAATEYTLATFVVDGSGSTATYRKEMQLAVKAAVMGCQRNPRADNMMLRMLEFDDNLREAHGFKMLQQCQPADYENFMRLNGSTALFDSTYNAVTSLVDYAEKMTAQDYDVNAIVIVVTDGADNASRFTANDVKRAVRNAIQAEALESIVLILVGLNPTKDKNLDQALQDFTIEAGFRYIAMEDLTPDRFAKLADFISKSVSAQSQSLGTGGPSKPIQPSGLIF